MNKFLKIILAVMVTILILYTTIFANDYIFFTIGSVGGCIFILKLVLESLFPDIFKDKEKK